MYNIGITGVGGGVGQSIIKSLADAKYNLIGLDSEVLAPGLYAVAKSFIIPYANSANYIERLLQICKKEKIDLLFPGLDAELMPLALHKNAFKDIGTTVIVSNADVIKISDDKQETYNKLTAAGITVPFTTNLENYQPADNNFPLIIKQQVGGARSKNIFLTKNIKQWEAALKRIQNKADYIVMDYIEGDEYTCGTVNLNNECKGVIVMRRILRDGDTHKCFSVKNTVIEETVRKTATAIKPFGACNIQLKLRDGIPYIFEINARCSGTTAARTLCGFNEPKMIAEYLLENKEPAFNIQEKTILRYWKELVVENESVETVQNNHALNQEHFEGL